MREYGIPIQLRWILHHRQRPPQTIYRASESTLRGLDTLRCLVCPLQLSMLVSGILLSQLETFGPFTCFSHVFRRSYTQCPVCRLYPMSGMSPAITPFAHRLTAIKKPGCSVKTSPWHNFLTPTGDEVVGFWTQPRSSERLHALMEPRLTTEEPHSAHSGYSTGGAISTTVLSRESPDR